MKTYKLLAFGCGLVIFISSCTGGNKKSGMSLAEGASGNLTSYESSDVNAIQQALPTIMVLPSDNLLKKYGALKIQTIGGRNVTLRDYAKYMVSNPDNKSVLSQIQNYFVQVNYPIQSLEQALKQLESQSAYDVADQLDKDTKTILLSVVKPDMIIELDYNSKFNNNIDVTKCRSISYTLDVIDPYTNMILSSRSGEEINQDISLALKTSMQSTLPELLGDIQKSFSDILTKGRNITVRIAVEKGSNVSLSDTDIDGDTYTDWCVDYVKTHTVKGAYKMQTNTNKELYFMNCRIALLNDDGTQYGVYDWTRDFCKSLRKNLGVKATNKAQGLGEVLITISGM